MDEGHVKRHGPDHVGLTERAEHAPARSRFQNNEGNARRRCTAESAGALLCHKALPSVVVSRRAN
jgi:hypothetical protein